MSPRRRWAVTLLVLALLVALGATSLRVVRSLMMTRRAVATYVAILAAVNAQDLDVLGPLCTDRYLKEYPPDRSPGGGVVGLPRGIHPNFQAWRQGDEVWLCPTDRVGPVYRFVFERGRYRFDGPVGLLRAGGRVERSEGVEVPGSWHEAEMGPDDPHPGPLPPGEGGRRPGEGSPVSP